MHDGVYCDGARGATLQEREGEGADTRPDIEHGAAHRRRLNDPIDQQSSCWPRPFLTVASQLLCNLLLVELLIVRALEW